MAVGLTDYGRNLSNSINMGANRRSAHLYVDYGFYLRLRPRSAKTSTLSHRPLPGASCPASTSISLSKSGRTTRCPRKCLYGYYFGSAVQTMRSRLPNNV